MTTPAHRESGGWCNACGLPVPRESTPNPPESPQAGVSTECLIAHPPAGLVARLGRWAADRIHRSRHRQ